MSRLLTLMLLYQHGYIVGKYISLEKLIEENKQTYYETLQESSTGWDVGNNNYLPFLQYQLGLILKAYREFERRVEHVTTLITVKFEKSEPPAQRLTLKHSSMLAFFIYKLAAQNQY